MAHLLLMIKAGIGAVIVSIIYGGLMIELRDTEPSYLQSLGVGLIAYIYIFVSGLWEMADWE